MNHRSFNTNLLSAYISYKTLFSLVQPPLTCAEVNIGLHYDQNREELHVYLDELRALRLEASPVYKYKGENYFINRV